MAGLLLSALLAVRGGHDTPRDTVRTERGASMVEYALLVGLIAVVAVIAVIALGTDVSGLFSNANNCMALHVASAC